MGRHAYLMLVHKNPGQVRKLLGLLDDARNDIFVHIDRKAGFSAEDICDSCRKSNLQFLNPSIRVHWGGISIMKAELELLKKATEGNYDYYHLLSGMDLPLKSQDTIHSFFDSNPGREFLMLWKPSHDAKDRVDYYRLFPDGNRFPLTRWANDLFTALQKFSGSGVKTADKIYFSSQWFSIENDFAHALAENAESLIHRFSHVNICDEIFLATTLMASEYAPRLYDNTLYEQQKDIQNMSNLRYVDWSRGGSGRHPWTFTSEDLDTLLAAPHFWARKFDERIDGKVIDSICRTLEE